MTAFQGLLAEGGERGKRNVLRAKPQLKDLLMAGVCSVRWGSCGDGKGHVNVEGELFGCGNYTK